MLQMHGNSVIRLALQANATRFIQDRRNHYWQDNGVTWHEFGRESFALEEDCEIMGDWQEEHNPSCNKMHEIDMTEFVHRDTVRTTDNFLVQRTNHRGQQKLDYITTGGFRSVWKVSEYDGTERALKTLRYSEDRSFDERTLERHRVDAVAMEQLTASPYVADIYGYCANSVLVDYSYVDLDSIFRRGNQPTHDERFKIALDTASAVADMHHFNSDGRATIAHKDIKTEQWILIDGMYKLNDFNMCKFLTWNPKRKQYCGYSYGYSEGRVSLALNGNVPSDCSYKSDI
jgi:Protein kinase domain